MIFVCGVTKVRYEKADSYHRTVDHNDYGEMNPAGRAQRSTSAFP